MLVKFQFSINIIPVTDFFHGYIMFLYNNNIKSNNFVFSFSVLLN